MKILSDEIIAARAGWSREIARGQVLRLVDLEGKQAVDFLCYNARDYEDRYAAADTMKANGSIFIRKGTVIYSVNCNPMFTVLDDTCGFHDTIGGCCSSALYVPAAADGAMDMGPSISKPGDYLDLRAEMDVLAVVSNCPQMNNPVNDYNPTPVRAIVYQPGA